ERLARKPREIPGRLKTAGVHSHQGERKDQRKDPVRRLAQDSDHRSSAEIEDLRRQGHSCSDSVSSAPSSERPVLARKTSSRVGAWRGRWATRTLEASGEG